MAGCIESPVIETLFVKKRKPPGIQNISIIVQKNSSSQQRKRKKTKQGPNQILGIGRIGNSVLKQKNKVYSSLYEFPRKTDKLRTKMRSSDTQINKSNLPYCSKVIVNTLSEYRHPDCFNPFGKSVAQVKWRVYRCQLSTPQESCCCSCNSDAMFEVMKSLYDCYKKKNCNNCKCILCGHMPRQERKVSESTKSVTSTVGVETDKEKVKMKQLTRLVEKDMEGKSKAEKEKILRDHALTGAPMPKGKTASEKSLIKRIKQETKGGAIDSKKDKQTKEVEKLLEGKTTAEKEKILRDLAKTGAPLPKGKTKSEKSIITKIKKEDQEKRDRILKKIPEDRTASEKSMLKRMKKGESVVTKASAVKKAEKEMEGKSKAEKEKILRDLAKSGKPLPTGKTVSEKSLIQRIEKDRDSKKELTKKAEKEMEGKSKAEKEKILRNLAKEGAPLPVGKTASEKILIKKIKDEFGIPAEPSAAPLSERLEKAKAAGLITPLAGKTPEQREKILRGLAAKGIPLPEPKTASERKIIDKVRKDLGLPPEPKTADERKRIESAHRAGIITPLEGKSKAEKKKILEALAERGIPLPEGRTPSEKALIAQVKAETKRRPSAVAIPSEKLRKAKAEGLLTPLAGKTPEQREKILKGLVAHGIPLPEPKTASERKIIDKVRKDLGLPPEPKTADERKRMESAHKAGLITPLEGKSKAEKKKILEALAERGVPLPEGRTPSEKALIAQVKAETKRRPSAVAIPSEKLRKAKAEGLLTPLAGKTPEQREKILKGLVAHGIPLPEPKTASERKIIDKVRKDLGLPPEPKTADERKRMESAHKAGLITPLEGKSKAQKKKILEALAERGVPLPEGRTPSEKELIAQVKAETKRRPSAVAIPSEKLRKAKAEGLLTPLAGKTPEQREKILKGLVAHGIPLPEPKTASERKLINKVRKDLGLPPEPKTADERKRIESAHKAGLITPLEGKSKAEKKKILEALAERGIPLPEGRTPSEKALIAQVKAEAKKRPSVGAIPSEKLRKAKAEGLITPLTGKTPEQKEKILKGLVAMGLPLPDPQTASEKVLIDKVRKDAGLPPSRPPPSEKALKLDQKTRKGLKESKGPVDECICSILPHERSIPRIKEKSKVGEPLVSPEKLKKAKAEGLLTPLAGKTPEQKEKILRGLAASGIPMPEPKTPSDRKLVEKVRRDLGLPPEPKSSVERKKIESAIRAGIITPLEGKSKAEKKKILEAQAKKGVPLPEGRTPSEKALIAQVKAESKRRPSVVAIPSEKLRKAKAEGLLTPLAGKSPEQKEKILRGLAAHGIPLPEPKTASERKIIDKVRKDLGLPPEPKTADEKKRMESAHRAGLITPLEGKSKAQKKKILEALAERGVPLPEGRTPSEKELIAQVKAETKRRPSAVAIPSEKLRKAKAEGLLTPLAGKSPEQKEKILRGLAANGIPLPEPKTASDRKLIDKVRKDLGLPPEPKTADEKKRMESAHRAGLITPLEGKSKAQKKKILEALAERGVPLPEGRTPSEKELIAQVKAETKRRPSAVAIPSEKLRKAKAEGLLTPLAGKTPEQREKILKGLAANGIPLPEPKTASERKLIDKVRKDLGLPPEPKTADERKRMESAHKAGLITPLEGKSKAEKKKILEALAKKGVPLPEGRTPSEKELIAQVKAEAKRRPSVMAISSEKLRKAKAEGLLTPLAGKTPEQREKILKGLVAAGIPLPEPKSASEKKLIEKFRKEAGLPPEPEDRVKPTKPEKSYPEKALKLDQQTLKDIKESRGPVDECICGVLPHISEKSIAKIKEKAKIGEPLVSPEKLKKAKAEGLLTPLAGKTPEQKEKILRGLAASGIPLPEPKTPSEKKLVEKVKRDLGLPPEPKSSVERQRVESAIRAGIITPLEGKSKAEKKKILEALAQKGVPLPEGRTPSEKELIAKVKAESKRRPSVVAIPSEKLRKAKAEGLLTPLAGKTPEQREKILKGLVAHGIPLPEPKTASERKIIDKVRKDLGLPPEPKTADERKRIESAHKAGLITPLEGKSKAEKKKILEALAERGVPLPEGRTPSEKALIAQVKAETKRRPSAVAIPSEKLRKAKAEGLLTPLAGKSPEQKEKILRGLAANGIPLPEPKTASERKLIDKVRKDLGLPPEPKTADERKRIESAHKAGLITPLEGKSKAEKKKILEALAERGIPLPEGRTPSEKALIAQVKAETKRRPSAVAIPSEKLRKAKAEGLLTPLAGKSPEQKEKILRGLAANGIPLPEPKTASERKLIDKVRKELGLPPEPKTADERKRIESAHRAGIITPLEGKSKAEKKKILEALAERGIPLPEGRTPSERALIAQVKAETKRRPSVGAIPSEKLRKAKAEGLITPLTGKTPEQKEKILKGLVAMGLPLPDPQTASEKVLIDKVRKDAGLPPSRPPPSEKAIKLDQKTRKGLKESKGPVDECICSVLPHERSIPRIKEKSKVGEPLVSPEKLKKAKAEGLLTPLAGKTPEQKEKILRGLAASGIPMPEPKTPSDRKLVEKVKRDLGLPPEPKSSFERKRVESAIRAGIITPLEGKSKAEKERILKAQAEKGVPLPEGRTVSEKALIAKVKAESKRRPTTVTPSEKLKKAKAEGLLTPLEGKTPEQKERILKGLATSGIPLPEPKTASEKKLVKKVRKDLGLPPEPKTAEERRKMESALRDGIITPLEGKTSAEKERILRAMADEGIALPEGRTASEKALIKKVKTESERFPKKTTTKDRIPPSLEGKTHEQKEKILKELAEQGRALPEAKTESEKQLIEKIQADAAYPRETPSGKIKMKSKKVDATLSKKAAKGTSSALRKAGVTEELEEITKTTTCERGCGCNKKKIRFKHSYVKIRVTSPDISSLCDCPEECLPGVKGGVFVDSEGIKVTVGSAVGVPSLSSSKNSPLLRSCTKSDSFLTVQDKSYPQSKDDTFLASDDVYKNFYYSNATLGPDLDYLSNALENDDTLQDNCSTYLLACSESYTSSESELSLQFASHTLHSSSSFCSEDYISVDTSLSFISESTHSTRNISLMSVRDSTTTFNSSLCNIHHFSKSKKSVYASESELSLRSHQSLNEKHSINACHDPNDNISNIKMANSCSADAVVYEMAQARNSYKVIEKAGNDQKTSIIVLNNLKDDADVLKIVNEILAKNKLASSSSIYVVVPTSSDEFDSDLSETMSSTICINLSENYFKRTSPNLDAKAPAAEPAKDKVVPLVKKNSEDEIVRNKAKRDKQISPIPPSSVPSMPCVMLDTTEDRPCCCLDEEDYSNFYHKSQSIISEFNTTMLCSQGTTYDKVVRDVGFGAPTSCEEVCGPSELSPLRHIHEGAPVAAPVSAPVSAPVPAPVPAPVSTPVLNICKESQGDAKIENPQNSSGVKCCESIHFDNRNIKLKPIKQNNVKSPQNKCPKKCGKKEDNIECQCHPFNHKEMLAKITRNLKEKLRLICMETPNMKSVMQQRQKDKEKNNNLGSILRGCAIENKEKTKLSCSSLNCPRKRSAPKSTSKEIKNSSSCQCSPKTSKTVAGNRPLKKTEGSNCTSREIKNSSSCQCSPNASKTVAGNRPLKNTEGSNCTSREIKNSSSCQYSPNASKTVAGNRPLKKTEGSNCASREIKKSSSCQCSPNASKTVAGNRPLKKTEGSNCTSREIKKSSSCQCSPNASKTVAGNRQLKKTEGSNSTSREIKNSSSCQCSPKANKTVAGNRLLKKTEAANQTYDKLKNRQIIKEQNFPQTVCPNGCVNAKKKESFTQSDNSARTRLQSHASTQQKISAESACPGWVPGEKKCELLKPNFNNPPVKCVPPQDSKTKIKCPKCSLKEKIPNCLLLDTKASTSNERLKNAKCNPQKKDASKTSMEKQCPRCSLKEKIPNCLLPKTQSSSDTQASTSNERLKNAKCNQQKKDASKTSMERQGISISICSKGKEKKNDQIKSGTQCPRCAHKENIPNSLNPKTQGSCDDSSKAQTSKERLMNKCNEQKKVPDKNSMGMQCPVCKKGSGNKNVGSPNASAKSTMNKCPSDVKVKVCPACNKRTGNKNVGSPNASTKSSMNKCPSDEKVKVCPICNKGTGNKNVGSPSASAKSIMNKCECPSDVKVKVCPACNKGTGNKKVGSPNASTKSSMNKCPSDEKVKVCPICNKGTGNKNVGSPSASAKSIMNKCECPSDVKVKVSCPQCSSKDPRQGSVQVGVPYEKPRICEDGGQKPYQGWTIGIPPKKKQMNQASQCQSCSSWSINSEPRTQNTSIQNVSKNICPKCNSTFKPDIEWSRSLPGTNQKIQNHINKYKGTSMASPNNKRPTRELIGWKKDSQQSLSPPPCPICQTRMGNYQVHHELKPIRRTSSTGGQSPCEIPSCLLSPSPSGRRVTYKGQTKTMDNASASRPGKSPCEIPQCLLSPTSSGRHVTHQGHPIDNAFACGPMECQGSLEIIKIDAKHPNTCEQCLPQKKINRLGPMTFSKPMEISTQTDNDTTDKNDKTKKKKTKKPKKQEKIKTCSCKHRRKFFKKKKSKNLCKCPALFTEDVIQRDELSSLTQLKSGFNLNTKKRPPGEMTFEQALKYYEMNPEEDPDNCVCQSKKNARCVCRESVKDMTRKKSECVCPTEPEPEILPKGLSFFIPGKGSASPGLSGVCCFESIPGPQ